MVCFSLAKCEGKSVRNAQKVTYIDEESREGNRS